MIDVNKVHPLFLEILDKFAEKQGIPVVTRFMGREEYLEQHESREELREQHSDYGFRRLNV